MSNVIPTIGAAFSGCLVAVALSALVGFQTFIYFLVFPSDSVHYKLLVAAVWACDLIHTVLICTAVWSYTIVNFNNPDIATHIFRTIAAVVTMTGLITFLVNGFYIYRIFKLSKQNWMITAPVFFLTFARLGVGITTSVEMIRIDSFPAFKDHFKILFTAGLIISAVTDIIVSFQRYWYLRDLKQGYATSREMVDTSLVFTVNDGILTCIAVIAVIIFWLVMPHNFVYLSIYFSIGKLYANSLLATLNLRNWFRHRYNLARPTDIVMTRKGALTGVHVAVERERVGAHGSVMMSPGPSPQKALPIDDADNGAVIDQLQFHMKNRRESE